MSNRSSTSSSDRARGEHDSRRPSFLRRLHDGSPTLFDTIGFLLAAEFIVTFLAPKFLPQRLYLSLYLTAGCKSATDKFLDGSHRYFIYDDLLGWRNRPVSGDGYWQIDSLGSRSTHPFTQQRGKPVRALFLGSSLMNGSAVIPVEQSMSAQVEDSLVEALNFGSMRYELDQVVLQYERRLAPFNATHLVVGLPGAGSQGLLNRYLPFRFHFDVDDMPFVKPRAVLHDTGLIWLEPPSPTLWRNYLSRGEFVRAVSITDGFRNRFAEYEECAFTPIASCIGAFFRRLGNLRRLLLGNQESLPLELRLMAELDSAAAANHAAVVYLLLPDIEVVQPPGWRRYLPDHYHTLLDSLRAHGHNVLDIREVFRNSGLPPRELYLNDGYHFSPRGNQLIATAIRPYLRQAGSENALALRSRLP